MITTFTYISLAVFGLILGSFAGATVWRIRARWVADYKKSDDNYDESEYKKLKKLTKRRLLSDRSCCLNCSYSLRWFDMIPVISWLFLRGKCRKCKQPIGYMEPLIELSVAAFFVLSYMFWPLPLDSFMSIFRLLIWLLSGVCLAVLFTFDAKWFFLPSSFTSGLIIFGIFNAALVMISSQDRLGALLSIAGSAFILSGIYLLLYKISQGKWIGYGDIRLGLGLALLLADWKLAIVALFAANVIGCIIVLPFLATKRLDRKSHVPFGPLLITGYLIAGLAGNLVINSYLSLLL